MSIQQSSDIFLSLVIPAYNEANRIPRTLEVLTDLLEKKDYKAEIIVIDDGSTDRTSECVLQFQESVRLLKNAVNSGKGYSVKRGMLEARGTYSIFLDADMSVPPQFIDTMILALSEGADVVIGTRRIEGASIEVHQPFIREKLGQLFNIIIRILGLSQFHDTQCGFKGFTREAVHMIFPKQQTNRFAFDVEILLIASQLGLRIKELPVLWYNSDETKVVPLRDPVLMLFDILKIRVNAWFRNHLWKKNAGNTL